MCIALHECGTCSMGHMQAGTAYDAHTRQMPDHVLQHWRRFFADWQCASTVHLCPALPSNNMDWPCMLACQAWTGQKLIFNALPQAAPRLECSALQVMPSVSPHDDRPVSRQCRTKAECLTQQTENFCVQLCKRAQPVGDVVLHVRCSDPGGDKLLIAATVHSALPLQSAGAAISAACRRVQRAGHPHPQNCQCQELSSTT